MSHLIKTSMQKYLKLYEIQSCFWIVLEIENLYFKDTSNLFYTMYMIMNMFNEVMQ